MANGPTPTSTLFDDDLKVTDERLREREKSIALFSDDELHHAYSQVIRLIGGSGEWKLEGKILSSSREFDLATLCLMQYEASKRGLIAYH